MNVFGLNEQLSGEEAKILRKNDLKNLLTSYADEADIFAEIIQNAVDAINSKEYKPGEIPELKIFIGRRANDTHYFAVSDNGIGMSADVMAKFTIPGFSFLKKIGKTVGYKGVGASFFFASAERISIQSTDVTNITSAFTVRGSYSWIMNETEPEPVVSAASDFPALLEGSISIGQGSSVCYYFHPGMKPKSLNNTVLVGGNPQNELENWVNFLCAKTSIGQIKDISSKNIKVTFYLDRGTSVTESIWKFQTYNKELKTLGYPYPWKVFAVHHEKRSIDSTPAAQAYKHKNKYQAIHSTWNKEEIEELNIDFSDEEKVLVSNHLDTVDLFFAYSTEILKEVNNRLGSRTNLIRYGIRIIVDSVPQGRMLDFDLTSNTGLNRQAHAVMSFNGLELDTGRKIPSNEIVTEVIRKIGVRIMNIMNEYKWCLRKKDRPPISSDLEEWRNNTRTKTVNSIVRTLFETKSLIPPISIDPVSENDVIALFTSLISNGFIKGYKLYALSGYARYDGLIDIFKTQDELLSIEDPFSIRDNDRTHGGELQVIEFKNQFADLIEDFEQRKKNPSEINLVVCWTLPSIRVSRGEITYCYGDRKDHRPLYGVTHIWTDENETSVVPIISLSNFVAEHLKNIEQEPGLGVANYNVFLQQDKDHSI